MRKLDANRWAIAATLIAVLIAMLIGTSLAATGRADERGPAPASPSPSAQTKWTPKFYRLCMETPTTRSTARLPSRRRCSANSASTASAIRSGSTRTSTRNLRDARRRRAEGLPALCVGQREPDGAALRPAASRGDPQAQGAAGRRSACCCEGFRRAIRRARSRPSRSSASWATWPPRPACGSRSTTTPATGRRACSTLWNVVKKANHPQVGVNFNLCHWLMVDGDKDYRPVLRENAAKIFVVTINGAKLGAKTWTNGLIQPLDQGDFDNRAAPGHAPRDRLPRPDRRSCATASPATPANTSSAR